MPGARSQSGPEDHTSPAPELGPQLSPRRSLRNLRAAMAQAELRLRRIESHVTSGQYELQRELNKLDGDGAGARDDGAGSGHAAGGVAGERARGLPSCGRRPGVGRLQAMRPRPARPILD